MMIYTTNMLAAPLVLLLWAVDLYMVVLAIRLIAGRLSGHRARELCACLRPFIDHWPSAVGKWMTPWMIRPIPPWLPWAIVAVGVLTIRQALACLVVLALASP